MSTFDEQANRTRAKYADIIDLPRPKSKRASMTLETRAAQFAPFAALTGYHESVEETEDRFSAESESGGVTSEEFFD